MADWNPNEPRLLGLEWLPTVQSGVALDAASQIGAAGFTSTAAETVATLGAYFAGVTEPGQWLMEIYDESAAVIGAESEQIYRPNTDIARVTATNQAGATANLWQSIDETTLSLTDYVTTTVGNSASYDHEVASAAWPAGRRVKDVVVTFVGRQISGSHKWQLLLADSVEGYFTYFSETVAMDTGLFTATVSLGESNPFTGLPWWQGDITGFDTAAKYLRWRWVNPSDEDAEARLYQVYVTVVYATENRECVAALSDVVGSSDATDDGWRSANVVTPAGGATWAKLNTTDYVVTVRRFRKSGAGTGGGTDVPPPSETGRGQWRYLQGPSYVPSRWSWNPTLDSGGGISDLGDQGNVGYAFYLDTVAPGFVADSQLYTTLEVVAVGASVPLNPTVNQSPTRWRFLIHSSSIMEGQLEVVISGPGPVNMTGFITAAEVAALPFYDLGEQWRLVEIPLGLGLATLVAGSSYTGTVTATAGTWYAANLVFDWVPIDQVLVGMSVEPPAAPTNPAIAAGTTTVPGDGSNCTADLINGADMSWTATALGADFARYDISRNETGTADIIISQLDETIVAAYDYTALRGVAADYCIRVVDTLGVGSDWVALGQVIAAAVDCELIFVSNERLDVSVTGQDEPVREWDFLSPPATVFLQLEGRDYQVAITPTEWRGDKFRRDVMLWGPSNGAAPPGSSGRVVFDRILELAQADVAYVAVLDSDGRRWLATIQPTRGRRLMPGQQHVVTVDVTEITADPLVEIDGTQVAP